MHVHEDICRVLSDHKRLLDRLGAAREAETRQFPTSSASEYWLASAPKPERKCEECRHYFELDRIYHPRLFCRAHLSTMRGPIPFTMDSESLWCLRYIVAEAYKHNPEGKCEKWEARC